MCCGLTPVHGVVPAECLEGRCCWRGQAAAGTDTASTLPGGPGPCPRLLLAAMAAAQGAAQRWLGLLLVCSETPVDVGSWTPLLEKGGEKKRKRGKSSFTVYTILITKMFCTLHFFLFHYLHPPPIRNWLFNYNFNTVHWGLSVSLLSW